MAGIGFAIKRMFRGDTITADLGAYLSGGLVLTGSWVFTALAIAAIAVGSSTDLPWRSQAWLLVIITYSFCSAMLLTSALSLPLTRYIADRLYVKDTGAFGPAYAAASLIHCAVAVLVGLFLFEETPLTPVARTLSVLLVVCCTQIWATTAAIGLLHRPALVTASYVVSCVIAVLSSVTLGKIYELEGYLGGVVLGMSTLALMLTAQLVVRLPFRSPLSFAFLKTVWYRPELVIVGVSLAVGTWIDKVVFWVGESRALRLAENVKAYPPYDISFFMGYITVVPAFALSLIRLETVVAQHVARVYGRLIGRQTHTRVASAKRQLASALDDELPSLLRTQVPVTLAALYFAPAIVRAFHLTPDHSHLLQLAAVTSIGIVVMQTQIVYLLYFDLGRQAAIPALLYALLNLTLNVLSLKLGFWSYGLGHLAAAFVAAAVGMALVARAIPRLEFITLSHYAGVALTPTPGPRVSSRPQPAREPVPIRKPDSPGHALPGWPLPEPIQLIND